MGFLRFLERYMKPQKPGRNFTQAGVRGVSESKRIPKGMQQYYFNNHHEMFIGKLERGNCVYDCIAINNKNAWRKYWKWDAENT